MSQPAAVPRSIQALAALTHSSPDWKLSPSSTADMHIYIRPYPGGWVDVLVAHGEHDAHGHRADAAGFTVWRHEGGLADVADALRGLPAPDSPGAPALVIPGRDHQLWTPYG